MKVVLAGVLYILGGLIHLFDVCTDIWYVYTQEFHSEFLYYLSLLFLALPSIIFLLAFSYQGLVDFCRCKPKNCSLKICAGLVLAILEPFGMILCIFGCIIAKKNSNKMDFYLIEAAARTAGFVEGVFESLPQLIVQGYNNAAIESWTLFTITSMGFSGGGFLYTCLKLIYALDKVRHFESEIAHRADVKTKNSATESNNHAEAVEYEGEAYEFSNSFHV